MKQKKNKEKGFILITSLLILAISTAIGGSIVYTASKQVSQSKKSENTQQAFHAAEAGMLAAQKWLQIQYKNKKAINEGPSVSPDTITCFKGFENFKKNPRIVVSDNQSGKKKDVKFAENYTYTYYISEFSDTGGTSDFGHGVTDDRVYSSGGAPQGTTVKRFLSFICGNASQDQRVNLEVLFRAVK